MSSDKFRTPSYINSHPLLHSILLHNRSQIRHKKASTKLAIEMRILFRGRSIFDKVLFAFSELDILGEWVDVDGSDSLTMRAITFYCSPALLTLCVFLVERWRDSDVILDCAAMAVKVVGCRDAIRLWPRRFGCHCLGRLLSANSFSKRVKFKRLYFEIHADSYETRPIFSRSKFRIKEDEV